MTAPARRRAMPENKTIVTAARDAALSADVLIQSPLWDREPDAERVVREALDTAASSVKAAPSEVSVVLTDDAAIRALNKQWRAIDKATNVLSFPAAKVPQAATPFLGDIVIAHETLARECADENKPFLHHLAHLTVHGFLHLMGYDHETDSDAEAMERLESAILARLDVPDPYRTRDLRDA
jgi:probable rRNA maturation factor